MVWNVSPAAARSMRPSREVLHGKVWLKSNRRAFWAGFVCDARPVTLGTSPDRHREAEACGAVRLRFRARDESGSGDVAEFCEQGQWCGSAFDRAGFDTIRAMADAMRVAVEDSQRD